MRWKNNASTGINKFEKKSEQKLLGWDVVGAGGEAYSILGWGIVRGVWLACSVLAWCADKYQFWVFLYMRNIEYL